MTTIRGRLGSYQTREVRILPDPEGVQDGRGDGPLEGMRYQKRHNERAEKE